jgi:DNA-directed RNA polymerase subunit alpha
MPDSISSSDILVGASEESHDSELASKYLKAGLEAEQQMNRWSAIENYEKAFQHAPEDDEVCFRLAYNLDLVGEDSEALHLYEQCCEHAPAKINALMNLAIMYEDRGQFARAEKCLRQVVDTDPNHRRARLFLKDVQASRQMFYDEDQARIREKQSTMLETPISDFELSVRARNCLKKMNIRTLGDLLRTSEAELLAYKNFGETSLLEIKAVLAQKGLHLGQAAENRQNVVRDEVYNQLVETGQQDKMNMPVSELNLSVRARKALSLLSIQTIGDLVSRTEAELLGVKNFGATSLDEIKEKLSEEGLSLRQLDE